MSMTEKMEWGLEKACRGLGGSVIDRRTSGMGECRARPGLIKGGSHLGKNIPGGGDTKSKALRQERVWQV